jgi:hypothetical protein
MCHYEIMWHSSVIVVSFLLAYAQGLHARLPGGWIWGMCVRVMEIAEVCRDP